MNCKPGDLAVIVRPTNPENAGKIVTVLQPIGQLRRGEDFIAPDGRLCYAVDEGFYWWCEAQTLVTTSTGPHKRNHAGDHQLRPIRDPGDDAVDEMVQRLGKPTPQTDTVSDRPKETSDA